MSAERENLRRRAAKLLRVDRDAALREAEKFLRQGRLNDAIALYQEVIEKAPDDWATANALGDLYVRAGSIENAAAQYTKIADHFLEDGFLPKAVALYKKILRIRPDDETCRLRLGEIAAQQGLVVEAKAHLEAVRDRRFQRGDQRGGMEVVIKLGSVDESDTDARLAATRALAEMGERDKAVSRMTELAAEFSETGQHAEALAALREAARFDPDSTDVRGAIARSALASGDLETAGQYLTRDVAGDDSVLLTALVELDLKSGRVDSATEIVQILAESPEQRQRVIELGHRLASADPNGAFVCIEVVADTFVTADDWRGAADTLEAFSKRAPDHVPTLLRLVEVCVDGGLDAILYAAQARLAEAYLQEGRAFEARVISEDLAVREPGVGSHIDRLRRALIMAGEGAPDRVIAQRLSEAMLAVGSDQPSLMLDTQETTAPSESGPVVSSAPLPRPRPQPVTPPPQGPSITRSEEPSVSIEMPADPPPAPPGGAGDWSEEVDLTLTGLGGAESPPTTGEGFGDIREAVSQQTAADLAAQQYKLALTYRDMGMMDEAVTALELASKSPAHRFASAAALGRLHRDRDTFERAIYWFERAAEAPAPSLEEGRALLYELGDVLERTLESARALAVFLELQADAGEYRDVSVRAERLARVVTGG